MRRLQRRRGRAVQFGDYVFGGGILCKEASLAKLLLFFPFFRVRLSTDGAARGILACALIWCVERGVLSSLSPPFLLYLSHQTYQNNVQQDHFWLAPDKLI